MSKWTDNSVYRMNKFLTDKLREEGIIEGEEAYTVDLANQDNFVVPFFVATQPSPETNTMFNGVYSSQPFGVYTYEISDDSNIFMNTYSITYLFYSEDIDKLYEIATYTTTLLKRFDDSAAAVNYHFIEDPTYTLNFKTIRINTAVGAEESDDEGGRHSFMINLTYRYTYEGTGRNEDALDQYPLKDYGLI